MSLKPEWVDKVLDNGTKVKVDNLGNILHEGGAVTSKACQGCGLEFKSEPIKSQLTQAVPFYICKECNFTNNGPEAALDHKIKTSHEIEKSSKDRVVSVITKIQGSIPRIKPDGIFVSILCEGCNGN